MTLFVLLGKIIAVVIIWTGIAAAFVGASKADDLIQSGIDTLKEDQ